MTYFIIMVALALGLTFLALRVSLLLFRVGATLSWIGLAVYLLVGNNANLSLGDTWTQVLGFVFLVMAFATMSLQFITEVRRESGNKGPTGAMGTPSESWSEWGPKKKPGKVKPTSAERQATYRKQVRGAVARGEDRRRAANKRNPPMRRET